LAFSKQAFKARLFASVPPLVKITCSGRAYKLSQGADDINIAQVILAVDEQVDLTNCESKGNCQKGA
jgi:hypothetical protein